MLYKYWLSVDLFTPSLDRSILSRTWVKYVLCVWATKWKHRRNIIPSRHVEINVRLCVSLVGNVRRRHLSEICDVLIFYAFYFFQGSASLLLTTLEKEKELLRVFLKVSQMENLMLRRMNLSSFLMVSAFCSLISHACKQSKCIRRCNRIPYWKDSRFGSISHRPYLLWR